MKIAKISRRNSRAIIFLVVIFIDGGCFFALPLTAADMAGGDIEANKLSLTTNIVGRRHFPKLQYSHLAYTVLAVRASCCPLKCRVKYVTMLRS